MQWLPPLSVAALSTAIVAYALVDNPERPAAGHSLILRVAMPLLAAGAAFALEDPAAATVAPAPVTQGERRMLRIALAAIAWMASWGAVLILVNSAGGGLAAWQLSLEAVGWFVGALAVASWLGAVATAPALLVAYVVVIRLPEDWSLTGPLDGLWHIEHWRWAGLSALAVVAVLAAAADPARRGLVARRRSPRDNP